jgi:cell division protein FtsB
METDFYRKKRKRVNLRGALRKLLRNRRLLALLVLGTPLLLYVVFGPKGVLTRWNLQQRKARLEEDLRAAEVESRKLEGESKALDGDKDAIEKVAREKYGMVRPGETVYHVTKK